MRKTFDNSRLDIITPVKLEADWESAQTLAETLRYQKEHYGITRFALGAPSIGWKTVGFPPLSHFEALAKKFAQVRDAVQADGIRCGYLNMMTVLSGGGDGITPIVQSDGAVMEMTGCPLDPVFQRKFAESNALFARIAKPDFIFFEDDYGINANVSDGMGCFCRHHLEAFARRCGRLYTREELVPLLRERTPEGLALLKRWRELMRDSMVELSQKVRQAVDLCNPEIPIGNMQPAQCDRDGDMTESVARALAGPNHTPFCRIYGTLYGDIFNAKNVPEIVSHALYSRQHMGEDFCFYHESDTYPHTRYFLSAKKIGMYMMSAYSMGFDGSTFQTVQILDDKNEETAYGKLYAKEWRRFSAVSRMARQCTVRGVEITYDPFFNTIEYRGGRPFWIRAVSLFGIPVTTLEAPVAFWDWRMARYAEHETVIKYLSKGLFLDGAAAKELCSRGYGKYLGVEVGKEIFGNQLHPSDHCAREIILPPFDVYSKGVNMWAGNQDAAGRKGTTLLLAVTDPGAEVITQICSFRQEPVCPGLVRFQNELGGRIVVQAMTVQNNMSGSLLNYRRQRLYQALIRWGSDDAVMAENEPNIYIIENESKDGSFVGMLTVTNLGEDPVESLKLHLPPRWQKAASFRKLDRQGQWIPFPWEKDGDTLTVSEPLEYCEPLYILAE